MAGAGARQHLRQRFASAGFARARRPASFLHAIDVRILPPAQRRGGHPWPLAEHQAAQRPSGRLISAMEQPPFFASSIVRVQQSRARLPLGRRCWLERGLLGWQIDLDFLFQKSLIARQAKGFSAFFA